jgi:hypothetical protein
MPALSLHRQRMHVLEGCALSGFLSWKCLKLAQLRVGPGKLPYMLGGKLHIFESKMDQILVGNCIFLSGLIIKKAYPRCILHIFDPHLTKFCGSSLWLMYFLGIHWDCADVISTKSTVHEIYRLYPGYFVIMRNKKTMYIGEVLDIYKKGNNSKYGSLEFASNASSLSFLAVRVYLPLQLPGHVCLFYFVTYHILTQLTGRQ